MQKNLRLNVRVDHETAARLKALAAEQKRGMSEILREMIHEAPSHTELLTKQKGK